MEDKILQKLPGVQEGVLLKNYTTYKIGGPAKHFFIAKNKEDLVSALMEAKKNKLQVFILGGGSNLLVSDKGFNGLVIKLQVTGYKLQVTKVYVGAGESAIKIAHICAENGLSGLEWAGGLPGSIGGAIYGSAQAFGARISDNVESVEALNLKTLKFVNLTKKQCQFSLKNSLFKKNKNLVIISAILKLKKKNKTAIKNKIKEFLNYRRTHHPLNFPSAGSVFVNPEIVIKNKKLLKELPELSGYNEKGTIPAGYLISKCGLSGKKIGKAQISEKHCNFIINLGGAKAGDVLKLIKLAEEKVKNKFGIILEEEVQLVGF